MNPICEECADEETGFVGVMQVCPNNSIIIRKRGVIVLK